MRISDWSSDVCSSDLTCPLGPALGSGPMAKRGLPVNGSHGKGARMRQFSRHRRPTGQNQRGQAIRFWGRHAVLAALANPDRTVKRIWGTREALGQLDLPPVLPISYAAVPDLARPAAHRKNVVEGKG